MFALILGGSGSGKSELAERLSVRLASEEKLYIATMYPWDEESKERIKKHRKMRAERNFATLECFYHLEEATKTEHPLALLECMSNLVANEMYCNEGCIAHGVPKSEAAQYLWNGISKLKKEYQHVVVVSNDVFLDGTSYSEDMQEYLKILAGVNCKMAQEADLVVEAVCGIPVIHKGGAAYETML